MKVLIKRLEWFTCLALVVLAVSSLHVFWEALFSGRTLFSMDNAPVYAREFSSRVFESFTGLWSEQIVGKSLGGRPFHPTRLLALVMPPLAYRVWSYAFDMLLAVFACRYFLAGRRVGRRTAWIASVGMAFSGYFFTLIAAGHLGTFDMWPFAVLLFACVDRAVRRASLFHFSLAGACLAFGIMGQPDVMGLFAILAAAYGVLLLTSEIAVRRPRVGAYLMRVGLGAVLAFVFLAGIGTVSFAHLRKRVIPYRQEVRGKTVTDKWEFATNWSMPWGELLEFVAPCVYGTQTGDPAAPYWGSMGRSMNWAETKKGLMNLRQHSVYLGGAQLLIAGYGLIWALRRRRRRVGARESKEPSGENDSHIDARERMRRQEIVFWWIAGVVCCLLALGRHFPLYRIFYALPVVSSIRCPVKFLHLVEVCLIFAFGFGLDAVLSDLAVARKIPSKKSKQADARLSDNAGEARRRLFVAIIAAGVWGSLLLMGSFVVSSAGSSFAAHWRDIGLGQSSVTMLGVMAAALRHGSFVFFLTGGLVAAGLYLSSPTRSGTVFACGMLLIVACDMSAVAKRYVRVQDMSAHYAANPVADHIRSDPVPGRLSYHLSQRVWQHPLWSNFAYHNAVEILEPRADRPLSGDYQEFFSALGRKTVRLWQLTNVRYIAGPVKMLQGLAGQRSFEVVGYFDTPRLRVGALRPTGGENMLVRFSGSLPRALVYHNWESLGADETLSRLADDAFSPGKTLLVTTNVAPVASEKPPTAAVVKLYRRQKVVVDVNVGEPGILLLNDKYDADWRVDVDGEASELLRCNHIMRGVRVPRGAHTVVFTYRPGAKAFCASLAAVTALMVWAGAVGVLSRVRRRAETQVDEGGAIE
jgi:hypothetical protein